MKNFIIFVLVLVLFFMLGGSITINVTNNRSSFSMPPMEPIMFLLLFYVTCFITYATFSNKKRFLEELRQTKDDSLYAEAFAKTLPVTIFSLFVTVAVLYAFYCVRTHQEIFSMKTMQNVVKIVENFFSMVF